MSWGHGDGAPRAAGGIIATYPYRDEAGELLYEVVRYEPKSFLQRKPDGSGGWIWNLSGVRRRVLYRLPQIQRQTTVYIVEGEKDAEIGRASCRERV